MPRRKTANWIASLDQLDPVASYLDRIDARMRGLLTAAATEAEGRYRRDRGVIRFSREGEVVTDPGFEPTPDEARSIRQAILGSRLPSSIAMKAMPALPKELQQIRSAEARVDWPKQILEFWNIRGEFVMLQVRKDMPDGTKAYLPFTYYDDHKWRQLEPEGLLPLFGLDQIKHRSFVAIHEGAKAAAYCRWLSESMTRDASEQLLAHPWRDFISHAAHVGWIGGAFAPHRTDWSALNGIRDAYIVTDNDKPGVAAAQAIAEQLRVNTTHIQFTQEWPPGFDLADPFPQSMYKTYRNKTYYIGPRWRDLAHPATFATDLWTPPGRKNPIAKLRPSFAGQWTYLEAIDRFVSNEFPDLVREDKVLNKQLRPFSHTKFTSELIVAHYQGRIVKPTYRPSAPSGPITLDTAAFNFHRPTTVQPLEGADNSFWLEFLTHLFPDPTERHHVERWAATLIAKLGTKMKWGLLLVSETQGTGKGTFASILMKLVGEHNASQPTAAAVVESQFNSWAAHKRLVVIPEIYEGHSWKAYNKLKSLITETSIRVNEKFAREYEAENWAHILACSNDLRAIKMEETDRRWFYPEVTETLWPQHRFVQFYDWLECEGYGAIMQWAKDFGDYVTEGEPAPWTARKQQAVEDSRSAHEKMAIQLMEEANLQVTPICLALPVIMEHLRDKTQDRMHDNEQKIARAMRVAGGVILDRKIKIERRSQRVVLNRACAEAVALLNRTSAVHQINEFVRAHLKSPADVLAM